jgi:type IV pilus assembly protein PilE
MKVSTGAITCVPASRQLRGGRGFTLLEAMIVVGLIGILGAIALPSYLSYLKKANRADAKAILMETAQWMERYYTTNGSYAGAPVAPISAVSPKGATGNAIRYNVSVVFSGTPPPIWTATAVPANSQIGDSCTTLSVDNIGVTSPTTAGCW